MAGMEVSLDQPNMSLKLGSGLLPGHSLVWKARLSGWDQQVNLSNGKNLAEMGGSLFLRAPSIRGDAADVVGALYFIPAAVGSSDGVLEAQPDHFSIELQVSGEHVLRLIDQCLEGFGPNRAYIDVPDLKFGWAPDGSVKEWDVSDDRYHLPVTGLTLSYTDRHVDAVEEPPEVASLSLDRGTVISSDTQSLVSAIASVRVTMITIAAVCAVLIIWSRI